MRVIKGLILFCFSMLAVSACFDPPEFSETPKLFFKDIKFKEVGDAADYDSLILYLDFEDGDGNIGLSAYETSGDFEEPYNNEFYFLQTGTGDTIPIVPRTYQDTRGNFYTVLNDGHLPGKVVTKETRNLPNYSYLPLYDESNCYNYKDVSTPFTDANGQVTIKKGVWAPVSSIDSATYTLEEQITIGGRPFIRFSDPLLYRKNQYHNNIEVKFFRFENGDFVEYDWFGNYCISFDGRFSTSTSENPVYKDRPIEGSIRYVMANTSFISVFGNNTWKLKIRIRDRALNVSNQVVTKEFDLSKIR